MSSSICWTQGRSIPASCACAPLPCPTASSSRARLPASTGTPASTRPRSWRWSTRCWAEAGRSRHRPARDGPEVGRMPAVFTIGYQESNPEAVIGTLAAAGVTLLVDVRAVAASRRPGFSKRQLAAGVATVGIDYFHLRGLGTPPDGRLAARTGRYADMRRIFEAHMAPEIAVTEMDDLTRLVESGRPLCLLCFERHADPCHPPILGGRAGGAGGAGVVDQL